MTLRIHDSRHAARVPCAGVNGGKRGGVNGGDAPFAASLLQHEPH
jgi:hypothetical protein